MLLKSSSLLCKLIIAVFLVISSSLYAAEGGGSQYLPGFYGDFGMAVVPETGYYLSNFLGYSTADNGKDSSSLLFELPGVISATDIKIAGGKFMFGFYPYVLHTQSKTTQIDGSKKYSARGGAGDMYAVPLDIAWQWDSVSLAIFHGIIPPTGSYKKDRNLNAGRNTWTFDSNMAFTWLPLNGKYDLSINLGYMVNTKNSATQYKTGDEIHLDYLLGYMLNENLGLGVAGSYYRQVTKDTGNGVPMDAIQGEYSSIGPAMMYNLKLGEKNVFLSLKWLHEYNVNNHIPNDYIIFRTFLKF